MEHLTHASLAQVDRDESDLEVLEEPRPWSRGRLLVQTLGAAAALCVLAAGTSGGRRPSLSNVTAVSRLFLPSTSAEFMNQAVVTSAQVPQPVAAVFAGPSGVAAPVTDCGEDEEEYLGLCYDQCTKLTDGLNPFRQSAWTCCERQECIMNPFEFSCCKHNLGWCSGFDISGMEEGQKICPHKPGACVDGEELFLGICYKTCASMAPEFPFRVGPASCCQTSSVKCIAEKGVQDGLPGESITNPAFDVGVVCDGLDPAFPCKPHAPIEKSVS